MNSVWLVSGETGCHEDRKVWVVAAFPSEATARAFCDELNQWCAKHDCGHDSRPSVITNPSAWTAWFNRVAQLKNQNDPEFTSEDGTWYTIQRIPVRAE